VSLNECAGPKWCSTTVLPPRSSVARLSNVMVGAISSDVAMASAISGLPSSRYLVTHLACSSVSKRKSLCAHTSHGMNALVP
jgi:hypothetical protein